MDQPKLQTTVAPDSPVLPFIISSTENITINGSAPAPSSDTDVNQWMQQYLSWSGPKRARAQQQFLKANQLHHLVTLPALWRGQHRDFLSLLPDVLSVEILYYLGPQDLGNSLLVCRRWHERCTCGLAELIWETTYKAFWPMSNYLQNDVKRWTKTWFQLFRTKYETRSLWMDTAQLTKQTVFLGHTDRVRHVRVRADHVMSASWDGSVRLANLRDKSGTLRVLGGNLGTVFGAWFNGDLAGACSGESTIHVWQVTRGKQIAELRGHASAVYRAEPIDDETVVSCAADFVGVWKWRTGELANRLHGHTMDVHRLQVSSDYIVTGSYDNTVCVWDYPSCKLRWTSPPVHGGGVSCLHFCDNLLVTGSAQGHVFVWDLETGQQLLELSKGHNGCLVTCVWVESGYIVSTSIVSLASAGGVTCLWSADDGSLITKVEESAYINAWRNEIGLMFCAYSDGVLRVRDLSKELVVVRVMKHGGGPLYDVDVQGQYAATCGLDKRVVVWSVGGTAVGAADGDAASH